MFQIFTIFEKQGDITMKKILGMFMVLAIMFSLASCGVDTINETRIIGKWVGQTKIVSGILTETQISFDENGNGYLSTILDFGITFDYSIEDYMITIIPNTPVFTKTLVFEFEISGDELIFYDSDDEMIFTRIE